MIAKVEFSSEEVSIRDEIRNVYNAGDIATALKMSENFLSRFPGSHLANYSYAVTAGDYSYDPSLAEEEKVKLLQIAKDGISKLFNHVDFAQFPEKFRSSVRNEYYWFFELHEAQYDLGVENVEKGDNSGTYSKCVGAASMAKKLLLAKERDIETAQMWARRSLEAFREFEKLDPTWFNINFFSSRALAVLGQKDEARLCLKDMFRKQGKPVDPRIVDEFEREILEFEKALTLNRV